MNKDGKVLMDPGQIREFDSALMRALPKDMSVGETQRRIGDPSAFKRALRRALLPQEKTVKSLNIISFLEEEERRYRAIFNQSLNLADLEVPDRKSGFDRLIVIAQGLTLNGVYDECAKRFMCRRYTKDLDESVSVNDRVPDKTYAVWCRDRAEADEELKNLSADALKAKGIPCLTLLERMVL